MKTSARFNQWHCQGFKVYLLIYSGLREETGRICARSHSLKHLARESDTIQKGIALIGKIVYVNLLHPRYLAACPAVCLMG